MSRKRKPKKYFYHILLTSEGKQLDDICYAETEKRIYERLDGLMEECENVVFPVRYINKRAIKPADYELIVIKYKDQANPITEVKDDYGRFVKYESNHPNWEIIDRRPYDKEETFWVYGYHPFHQRKDFMWIYNEFIKKDADDKYKFKEVFVIKNKVIFNTAGHIEMVLCKCKEDAIRMYNMLEKMSSEDDIKYIIFNGEITGRIERMKWYDKLRKLTGWNMRKLTRHCLRP